jgi:integrase
LSSPIQIDLNVEAETLTLLSQGQQFDGQGESMARRRYQDGSVFLRGRKGKQKWIGRYREDVVRQDGSVHRVRYSVVLGTKSELTESLARRRLDELLTRVNSRDYRPGRIATVEEFAEWWKAQVLVQHKPSTVRAAIAHLRCHIVPRLGKLKLDDVTLERQQVFVTQLSQTVSRKSVLNIMGTLSSLLNRARKQQYFASSVKMGDLTLPDGGAQEEARSFNPEQVRQIIKLAEEPFRTMFCILAMTGVRAGELLGLKVDDLDFERRLIHIRRSVIRGRVQSVKSKASQKPLPLPDALVEILKQFLRTWRETPERWLFVNNRTRPYSADKVVTLKLWPILDALKIARCGLHAFRHFHASMLLELGAAPQVAQAQMRHSDPRVTLEVYGHVVGESQRKAVERVAEILAPVGPKTNDSEQWIH